MGSHPGVERGLTRPLRGGGEGNGELPRQQGVGSVCCKEAQELSLKPNKKDTSGSLSHPDTKVNCTLLLALQVSREHMLS